MRQGHVNTESITISGDVQENGVAPVILFVDDEPRVLHSLQRALMGYDIHIITATSADDGLNLLKKNSVNVVVSDNYMPEMDGITFLERVRDIDPDITRVMLTGQASLENVMEAINRSKIYEFLTKPWTEENLKATLLRSIDRNRLIKENKELHKLTHAQNQELSGMNKTLERRVMQRTSELADAVKEGIFMLALAAEAKDDDTGEHVLRIQKLTEGICLQLGMSKLEAENMGDASITHDVGKIHIPDHILHKPGPLTDDEMQQMRHHTIVGEKILGDSPYYEIARLIARSHHERVDGEGYPDGLKGNAIPLSARIVAVADVYDALTNERPYKSAWSSEDALNHMTAQEGKHFDKNVLKAFHEMLKRNNVIAMNKNTTSV